MGIKNRNWYPLLPDERLQVHEPHMDLFFETLFERQQIWKRRFVDKKSRPWTEDSFLHNNKFTNVYRELDRNSQWQIQNVFLKEKEPKNLLWKIMVFRVFNRPELFEWINTKEKSFEGFIPDYNEYNQKEFADLVHEFRSEGNNPFTNAYLINSQSCPGETRDWCYVNKVVPSFHSNIDKLMSIMGESETAEEIIEFLMTLPSVAAFTSHEYYQDFTYAPRYSRIKLMPFGQNDFTNVGPGASIGIRLIFPNLVGLDQLEGIYMLREMSNVKLKEIGDFPYISWDKKSLSYKISNKGELTLHQIEMWLCEFQKYWKMKIGMGKQRSVFSPRTKGQFTLGR